jgi:hypothetical protein
LLSMTLLILSVILLSITSEDPTDTKCKRSATTSFLLVSEIIMNTILIGASIYSMRSSSIKGGQGVFSMTRPDSPTPTTPSTQLSS